MPTVPSRVSSPLGSGRCTATVLRVGAGGRSSPTTPPVWATSSGWRPPVGSVTGCAWGGPHRDRARTLARHRWPRSPRPRRRRPHGHAHRLRLGLTGHRRVLDLEAAGLLGPDQVHVHANNLGPQECGPGVGRAKCRPRRTELNMGMAAWPSLPAWPTPMAPHLERRHLALNAGDLFTQMRLALAAMRQDDNDPSTSAGPCPNGSPTAPATLRWATGNGAEALAWGAASAASPREGRRPDRRGRTRLRRLAGGRPRGEHGVQASPATVRHVLIGGRWAKRDGALSEWT